MVIGLYFYSSVAKNRKNDFVREFPPHLITADTIKSIANSDLYIAGSNGKFVYLSSKKSKNTLLRFDLQTLDSDTNKIRALKDFNVYDDAEVQVESENIFLTQGFAGNIRSGMLKDLILTKTTQIFPFYSVVSITDTSYVIRYINKSNKNVLAIYSTQNRLVSEKNISTKQGDEIFSNDGILLKTPDKRIAFVYYYSNNFIVTDQNLNESYKAKTIDTNTIAKIKVKKIRSTGDLTMSAPPLIVNKEACANNDHLFIRSGLKADNQVPEEWSNSSTIDVYNLKNGNYEFSFYLLDLGKDKLVSFKVYNKTLVALYHNVIYTFKLNF
ncbi:hypothetical protein ASU31_10465 [Pedobacter ginsenosidimutans]|uniref:Two component regulator three Y domain-containing protein n=2 Tax=Pedobacter ginsenosidimutans TaxID=687842 RepID=A0A0T5VRS7_9SPHI|nr:hypothetical protein ASU31_10465 [Pedobacter ginsenosidimutans]